MEKLKSSFRLQAEGAVNPQENIGQWRAGTIRPLCVFSPARLNYGDAWLKRGSQTDAFLSEDGWLVS